MKKLFLAVSLLVLSTTANAADDQALAIAQLTAKMTQLEEENRRLNGRIEELEFQISTTNKTLEQARTEMQRQPVAAISEPQFNNNPVVLGQPQQTSGHISADGSAVTKPNQYTTKVQPTAISTETDNSALEQEFDIVFESVASEDYATAKPGLKDFIAKHPGTSLAGEAYFWLGEIAWSERDFNNAAINYLKGYKEAPKGEKASENILKMALTLKELGKKEEACKYITRFETEFPNAHRDLKNKGNAAKTDIGCK